MPEQLVTELRNWAHQREGYEYDLARDAATALSECRERERDLKQAAREVVLRREKWGGPTVTDEKQAALAFPLAISIERLAALAAQPPSEASERVASQPGAQPKADSERSGTT